MLPVSNQYLLLPLMPSVGENGSAQRRGSAESAYYSTCSEAGGECLLGGQDRRASWQAGDPDKQQQQQQQQQQLSQRPELFGHTCGKVSSASDSALCCRECELRRFRPLPLDRSPFHTRAHEEVVMKEFQRLCDGGTGGAEAAPVLPADGRDETRLAAHQQQQQQQQQQLPQQAVAAAAGACGLPPLPEELPQLPTAAAAAAAAAPAASADCGNGLQLVGRLNTLASCDLRVRRDRLAAAAPPAPATDAPSAVGGMRKLSLDAGTLQFSLLSTTSPNRVGGGGGGAGGLFRLFHQETSPEELVASIAASRRRRFANANNGNSSGSNAKMSFAGVRPTTASVDEHAGGAAAALGTGGDAAESLQQQQQPCRLFRRFQSTDDDYFVALKVEDPDPDVFPTAAPLEREKLLTMSPDGQTVVTEVSPPPSGTTSSATTAVAGTEGNSSQSPVSTHESELEAALRLAKTSRFAYVPRQRLVEADRVERPELGDEAKSRDTRWRRCVEEMSASSRGSTMSVDAGRGCVQSGHGSRVKRLMAKFDGPSGGVDGKH